MVAEKKIKIITLKIICRQQKLFALEKYFKEKIKTTCSRNNLQKTKKKTCSRNLQKTENLALELFCRKKNNLDLEICRKQKTWSECLQKTGNLVLKLAFMIWWWRWKNLGGFAGGAVHSCCSAGGSFFFSLSPIELVCDTESDHMTSVVVMFHTDCCCSSSSFAGFNPQLFTRPCNTSASSVMQTLVARAGKTSFITEGVDARRTVRKSSSSTCTDNLRLHLIIPSSPECQLLVRSSKLLEPKTTKDHRSLPDKSLMNSTLVLLTDHPAPTSEFSAEEEEKKEEVNNNSTSRGDLDSDLATGLLSPVLIRQQAAATEEEEGYNCQQEEEEYSQKPFHPGGSSSSWEGTKSSSCGSNGFSHKRR